MKNFFLAGLVVASVVAHTSETFSESRLPTLRNGMISGDVVKLWGEPVERIEEEVKRRESTPRPVPDL